MRFGKQRATAADELDEMMTARHDSSLDNVEHFSSRARQAITPQYPDALMRSHEHIAANELVLTSKQAGASGTSVMHADLAQPTSRACCLLHPSLLRCRPLCGALEQLFASPCPQLTSFRVPSHSVLLSRRTCGLPARQGPRR